jgi:hypothetical protein
MNNPKAEPVGYIARPLERRATRPLHRREAILAAAEAAFEKKPSTPPTDPKPDSK